jgi:hypothetical protein
MIRCLITIITLLATGAHAIFGCCLHHEHGGMHALCDADHAPDTPASVPSHACGCRHDFDADTTAASVPTEDSPCGYPHNHGNGHCDEGHCQYLTNAKVELPALDGHAVFAGLVSTLWGATSLSADGMGSLPPSLSSSLLSGSLSVRDLTQIARI